MEELPQDGEVKFHCLIVKLICLTGSKKKQFLRNWYNIWLYAKV